MKRIIAIIVLFMALVHCTPPRHMQRGQYYNRQPKRTANSRRPYRGRAGSKRIVHTAKRYIGVKYRSGGTSPRGFDCSGYVLYVYKTNGISLPRNARKQYYAGKRIRLRHARPGDLVFFQTSRKRISHVGIYLGNRRFIHAPSSGKRVSITSMKNPYWKKRYIGAVTYLRGRRLARK
ncbi:MAG: C40 family peptidase [bacterium]|nr:C40 family peptidase [bacterium]